MLKTAIRQQTLDIELLQKSWYMHSSPLELFRREMEFVILLGE